MKPIKYLLCSNPLCRSRRTDGRRGDIPLCSHCSAECPWCHAHQDDLRSVTNPPGSLTKVVSSGSTSRVIQDSVGEPSTAADGAHVGLKGDQELEARCVKGHILELPNRGQLWSCDGCNVRSCVGRLAQRYRCARCNYDLCVVCQSIAAHLTTHAVPDYWAQCGSEDPHGKRSRGTFHCDVCWSCWNGRMPDEVNRVFNSNTSPCVAVYDSFPEPAGAAEYPHLKTLVEVLDLDCFTAAQRLGNDACVLCMAEGKQPGGPKGAAGKSQLFEFCRQEDYPLPTLGALYVSGVVVFPAEGRALTHLPISTVVAKVQWLPELTTGDLRGVYHET